MQDRSYIAHLHFGNILDLAGLPVGTMIDGPHRGLVLLTNRSADLQTGSCWQLANMQAFEELGQAWLFFYHDLCFKGGLLAHRNTRGLQSNYAAGPAERGRTKGCM